MENPSKDWPLRRSSSPLIFILVGAPLITVLSLLPTLGSADPTKESQGGSQKFGSTMGQFMNSFMDGLNSSSGEQNSPKLVQPKSSVGQIAQDKKTSRSGKMSWQGNKTGKVYDPWGEKYRRNRPTNRFYDPWGASGDPQRFTRFADRDWAEGRNYYGAGTETWGGRGYNGYQGSQAGYPGYNQNWGDQGQNWPPPPNPYPYGQEGYGRANW
jgi:hypothetical protein